MYKAAIICSTVFPMHLHKDFYEFVVYNNNGFCEVLALLILKWICHSAFCGTLKPKQAPPPHIYTVGLTLFSMTALGSKNVVFVQTTLSTVQKRLLSPLLPSLKICQEIVRLLGTQRNCKRRDEVWNWITIIKNINSLNPLFLLVLECGGKKIQGRSSCLINDVCNCTEHIHVIRDIAVKESANRYCDLIHVLPSLFFKTPIDNVKKYIFRQNLHSFWSRLNNTWWELPSKAGGIYHHVEHFILVVDGADQHRQWGLPTDSWWWVDSAFFPYGSVSSDQFLRGDYAPSSINYLKLSSPLGTVIGSNCFPYSQGDGTSITYGLQKVRWPKLEIVARKTNPLCWEINPYFILFSYKVCILFFFRHFSFISFTSFFSFPIHFHTQNHAQHMPNNYLSRFKNLSSLLYPSWILSMFHHK